jgi:hypothetical protein
MSGEFLRAVLDKNAVNIAPAIYTIEAVVPNPLPTSIFGGNLQCKQDRYFLAMGAQFVFLAAPTERPFDVSFNLVQIHNFRTLSVFANEATKGGFWGGNMNAMNMLTDYMLFEPADLIGFRIAPNATQGTPLTPGDTVCCSLYGIEYAE